MVSKTIKLIRSEYCDNPTEFDDWMSLMQSTSKPHKLLKEFAINYHYFSIHQIRIFIRIFDVIPVEDTRTLSELAKVIFEELGEGNPNKVHSEMMKRFALYCGANPSDMPVATERLLPGVQVYLKTLRELFASKSLSSAIAAYLFLEETAVGCYEPIVALFEGKGYTPEDYEFFLVHSVVEVEHMELAEALIERMGGTEFVNSQTFKKDLNKLKIAWAKMWNSLAQATKAAKV